MGKQELNPFTGLPEKKGSGNYLDLIDDFNPSDTTVSATFVTLLSSALTFFSGRQVLFMVSATACLSAGTSTEVELAVQVDGGADNVISQRFINATSVHSNVVGFIIVDVPAGPHTINLRWRRAQGTGTVAVNADDMIQLKAVLI